MSLGLMFVTLSAAMLAMQPATLAQYLKSDYLYSTTLIKEYTWAQNVTEVFKATNTPGKCTAGVSYPTHYKCSNAAGDYVPFALQVQMLDDLGPAEVTMDTTLRYANAYRIDKNNDNVCEGVALVIISIACK